MKIFLFKIFLLLACVANGQSTLDLYQKVDSLIRFELEFVYDSTTDVVTIPKWDGTGMHPAHSTFPNNPSPLIILDGTPTKADSLKNLQLKKVASIEVHKKGDEVLAIYGQSGKNGVIIIQTKKGKQDR